MNEVVAPLGANDEEIAETVRQILVRFAHIGADQPVGTGDGLIEPVAKFQQTMGLAPTGQLDLSTVELLTAPRCGVDDGLIMAKGDTWAKTRLTYWLNSTTPDLPSGDIARVFREAFALWAAVTPLSFSPLMNADIVIDFVPSDHGDDFPFDGPGNVLAHAFYPDASPRGGDIHFDEAERWTDAVPQPPGGRDLFTVALHEIGHAIGLTHSSDPEAIMYPTLSRLQRSLALDDIVRIRDLYPQPGTPIPPTPSPPSPNPPGDSPIPPGMLPWDAPRVRQAINEWIANANRCFRMVEPGGYVDQWGRMCGQLSSGMKTCTSSPAEPGRTNMQYLWNNQNLRVLNYPYNVQDYMVARLNGQPPAELTGCS